MKNYIGISRDHSASMRPHAKTAAADYNLNIENIRESSRAANLDTIITTVKCGSGIYGKVVPEVLNSSVNAVDKISESQYDTNGPATPLFDSVGFLIEQFKQSPDYDNPDVSFLVMAITDGQDNASITWRSRLKGEIAKLQATDRWTFAFRVPKGHRRELERLGIPAGNILEWELTSEGLSHATSVTRSAVSSYYTNLAAGTKSTDKFFADLSQTTPQDLSEALVDISGQTRVWVARDTKPIKQAIEDYLRIPYKIGTTYYQLLKTETVQRQKQIAIRDDSTGHVYFGSNARKILGLPNDHAFKLVPQKHSKYDIFVQSTSVNRKIPQGSKIMYWDQK